VPSFARWPLKLHFFAPDVHKAWEKWRDTTAEPLARELPVLTDFRGVEAVKEVVKEVKGMGRKGGEVAEKTPGRWRETVTISDSEDLEESDDESEDEPADGRPKYGVHVIPATYEHLRSYIAKGDEVFRFEREGKCVVCREKVESGKGLHVLCSNDGCEGVGHLRCWSDHLLAEEAKQDEVGQGTDDEEERLLLPVQGSCPQCHGPVEWAEMMTELTLRTRGPKDVEKILRKKPRAAAVSQ
jgi:structure-specific endonuclease subunit SLX1